MTWPHATDYNAAVQNPPLCFRDDDLRQGQAVGDLFGLPRPHSGSFADVYQIQGRDGQSWAIKCFTRPVAGLQPRYQAISEHLHQTHRAFMVKFHFLDEGICIHGQWYPLVKMRWVEGLRLNEFIREQVNKPAVLERLAQMWVRLAQELRDADMAHGDLQHGNVLLVPGSKGASLALKLKLIDYDGMFVPALAEQPSGEVGHPNYQHPQRLREGGYDRHMDRFAHLLIYTALRCLCVAGEDLWQRHDNQENLLFREDDFRSPGKSKLLRELWDIKDRDIRYLLGHLLLSSQGPLSAVRALDEMVDNSGVRPLSDREEARIDDLLHYGVYAAADERSRVSIPTASSRGANAPVVPRPHRATVLAAAGAAEAAALIDTQPIVLEANTDETPLLSDEPTPRRSSVEIEIDAQPPELPAPARKAFDAATLTDPIVSILSRPMWLAALGVIALASFLVVNVLVWSSVKPPATTFTPRPPTLGDLGEVALKAGYKKVIPLAVERGDCLDELTIRIEGLPDRMTIPPLTMSATEDTASVTLLAPLGIGQHRRQARVSLWQGDDKVDEKTFALLIQDVPCPLLIERERIDCSPGSTPVFAFSVERRGCREPLLLRVEGLPPEVRQESAPAADPGAPSLKLIVAGELAPQEIRLKLLLHVGDVVADTKPLLLNIRKPEARIERQETGHVRLDQKTPEVLEVEAGTKGELRVFLDREGYGDGVQVRLEGLPDGVTARPVAVAAAKDRATLTIETRAETERGEHAVKLLVQHNDKTLAERVLTLNIEQPHPRQEIVHFPTVDHAELAGTLYHGWKGKKGMTVLMLHDLGQHRNTPGWQHLAEALQSEGHTVLTFDFRSYGDSHTVSPQFWSHPVNKYLPVRPEDKRANQLKVDHLPYKYLLWLIEDIAAARTYLDLRHDEPDGPVNTFNLVVIGAGQASALGSLWLATEGLRVNAEDVGEKTMLKLPEKLSVRQVVWLGLEDPLKLNPLGVLGWLRDAHARPEVPTTFVYGADDLDTSTLLREAVREKLGKPLVLPRTRWAGQQLVENDDGTATRIEHYLVKTLAALPPVDWLPRRLKTLHSYWALPAREPGMRLFVTAKRPGEEMLAAVPMRNLGIPVEGCVEVTGIRQKFPDR